MKKIVKVLIILGVCFLVLTIAKNLILKTTVEVVAKQVTGATLKMGSFDVNFMAHKVSIKDMRLYNPPGFPDSPMLDAPEITVQLDVGGLFDGKHHFPMAVVNVREVVLVRNKEGKLNVDSLKFAQKEKTGKEIKSGEKTSLEIDVLNLTIGQVVVKDYTAGGEPKVASYAVGVNNKRIENVKSPEQLVSLILFEAMAPTALKSSAIYGAATLLGVGFLPAGVAGILLTKDSATAEFAKSKEEVFRACHDVLIEKGKNVGEDKPAGILKASVNGASVSIKISSSMGRAVKVEVAARQVLIPKPEVAGGVLYEIKEKLK